MRGAVKDSIVVRQLEDQDATVVLVGHEKAMIDGVKARVAGWEKVVVDAASGPDPLRPFYPDGRTPGNLYFFDDKLVSQSTREIAAFPAPPTTPRP